MFIFLHELPQIGHEFFNNFFCLFMSALALFQAFFYAKNVFLFLFPKRSGFLFSHILPQPFANSITRSSGFVIPMP